MFCNNTPHDIFVDLNAESSGDDVCDSRTTIAGIALLQFAMRRPSDSTYGALSIKKLLLRKVEVEADLFESQS